MNIGNVILQISGYEWTSRTNCLQPGDVHQHQPRSDASLGVETIAIGGSRMIRVKAGLAYTRATSARVRSRATMFRSCRAGPAALRCRGTSTDVPHTRHCRSLLQFASDGQRSANFQPTIPATTVVDIRIGGKIAGFFWSFAVQNVFDVLYFDYAIASAILPEPTARIRCPDAHSWRGRGCSSEYANKRRAAGPPGC